MIFEGLADKLQSTFKKLRGRGKINEADVTEALREVRMALLEADVHFKVVKDLIARIKERAVGQEVLESLRGKHEIVGKILEHRGLKKLLGTYIDALPPAHQSTYRKGTHLFQPDCNRYRTP